MDEENPCSIPPPGLPQWMGTFAWLNVTADVFLRTCCSRFLRWTYWSSSRLPVRWSLHSVFKTAWKWTFLKALASFAQGVPPWSPWADADWRDHAADHWYYSANARVSWRWIWRRAGGTKCATKARWPEQVSRGVDSRQSKLWVRPATANWGSITRDGNLDGKHQRRERERSTKVRLKLKMLGQQIVIRIREKGCIPIGSAFRSLSSDH